MSIPALAQQQGRHLQTRPVIDGPQVMLTILMFTLPAYNNAHNSSCKPNPKF
jgi:hypothetical protein